MKKIIFMVAALAMVSCKKDEKKEETGGIMDAISGVKNAGSIASSMDQIQKKAEELKKLAPATNDELKAVFPESILGLKRTEVTAGDTSMMGMVSANAKFSDNAEKDIEISIMDGAGETGSAVISLLMMGLKAESEKTTPEGYEKTTNFNNARAMVSEKKDANGVVTSDIQYILKDRYSVKIEGDGYTIEQLKSVMDQVNSSSLK